MAAEFSDPDHIFLAVGLGFFAECNFSEAMQIASTVQSSLQSKLNALQKETQVISEDISQVEQLLSALRQCC